MNESPLVSIVIVNYNGRKWLEKLFDSLLFQTYKNFEIIFVDNASNDNSIEFINSNYKDSKIKIIKSNKNLGFAGGNNLGIEKSSGEYVLLLNNDVWVEQDFLNKMINSLKVNKLDIIAPKELDYYGKNLASSDYKTIDFLGHPFFTLDKVKYIFYLQGACLLFKKSLYSETGGLDNNFFMYSEETDWFWRLNLLKKKFDLDRDISFNHFGSGSTGGNGIKYSTFLWRNQNTLQMLIKNYSLHNLFWVLPIYFIQNVFEMIFFILILKPRIAFSYIQGWYFNIINLGEILDKRKFVQNNRLVSDREIKKKMYLGFAKLDHLLSFFKLYR